MAFLAGDIRFTDIDRVIESVLQTVNLSEPDTLDGVQQLDATAREVAAEVIAPMTSAETLT